jgi:hypothetical protein
MSEARAGLAAAINTTVKSVTDNYDDYNYRKRGIICNRCNNSLEYDNRSPENYCFKCILDTI